MSKVLIDIDDEALARASEILGTKTKKDTVNTALQETVRRLDRAAALAEMRELVTEGGVDLEVLDDKREYRR
ncbi:type II toxin-antitoxin system VapB family antitoxin [Nocardiopsis exhalans]|uniref:Type II toxin-antitoxin system VapB family antitoxin n=1 Tax=Nocardiopsis exhalans TaxID=163604 RepID=A0ABY5DEZ8_9ACTN|nr:type II toxin-antitoxin system VapB family antitoxin [Nocardiopsis exhalans]USY22038.1 type II toxin-antitoxin system VapB family antitoxin [Nocardiopsis exhalans]